MKQNVDQSLASKHKRISKFMSLVLRHDPGRINLSLDNMGWADLDELMAGIRSKGMDIDREVLENVVRDNDKQRFVISDDGQKIRANQGHSIEIDLDLKPVEPPAFLYHGTVAKFLAYINTDGLKKMSRQHVHLSEDRSTAVKVASRRGLPIILSVCSGKMHKDGYVFYQSLNGVWLTDKVPVEFIDFKKAQ